MKLLLGAYHQVGVDVLHQASRLADVEDIAVLTHDVAHAGTPDLASVARDLGCWVSTESINTVELPFEPDVTSLVYYRHIVRGDALERLRPRIFNLHPSLLPRHRGASSIPWAMIEGDPTTGITFHYVDDGVDTGRILLQAAAQIDAADTQATLYQRLMELGSAMWQSALLLVVAGVPGQEQLGKACVHRRGPPHGGEIDPAWDEATVETYIRAMTYPPLPPATFHGRPITSVDDYLRVKEQHARRD